MFFDIFQSLCNRRGTTPNAVCKELGFSNSMATYWKKSGKTPKRESVEKVAHYFGVSTDYLLGRSDQSVKFWNGFCSFCYKSGTTPSLVAEHVGASQEDLDSWSHGSLPSYTTLKDIASHLGIDIEDIYDAGEDAAPQTTSEVKEVVTDNVHMIPVYESVSAGFGAYADNHVVDKIPLFIRSGYEADETILIRVSGDSMSPVIEDGDLIQVHKQDSVDSGDIAVVLLDGEEGLVKKVVYDTEFIELISLNPKYRTRRFDGEEVLRLRVVGKVRRVIRDL